MKKQHDITVLFTVALAMCLVFAGCSASGAGSGGGGASNPTPPPPETVATPTANIPDGTYPMPISVALSTTSADADIYWTTDGNEPTTDSTPYTEEISISETATLKAFAVKTGINDSAVLTVEYTKEGQAAKPTATPPGGTGCSFPVRVELATTTDDAAIHYTLNGDTPTAASTGYTGAFDIAAPVAPATSRTLKAIALKGGLTASAVMTAVYATGTAAETPSSGSYTVTFNTNGGSTVGNQSVPAGATVAYPEEPAKPDNYFDGWLGGDNNPYNYGTAVSGNITLYAKWLDEDAMIAKEFAVYEPTIEVFNTVTWNSAKTAIDNGGNDKNYVIKVTGDFSLTGVTSNTFTATGIKVLIYSIENKTINISYFDGSLLRVGENQTLILRNITLQGQGTSAYNNNSLVYCGGGNAHLVIRPGTVVKDNQMSSGSGGGVYVSGSSSTFTMSGGTISGYTTSYGGGVYLSSGTFEMSGGTISGNTCNSGAVYIGNSSRFTMSGGTISGNTGPGVYTGSSNTTFEMSGGTISGNTCNSGAVYVSYGTFEMNGGTISGNTGCGVYITGHGVYIGHFTMSDGIISGNTASAYGGGVYVSSNGAFTMSDGIISGNTASAYGGGVYVSSNGAFTMSGGAISGNTVSSSYPCGGGVYVSSNGTFTMDDGAISGNTASYGGGVYLDAIGTLEMSGGTIYGSGAGAGLANTASSGASLYKFNSGTAKYGDDSDIIASGNATDETLVGRN